MPSAAEEREPDALRTARTAAGVEIAYRLRRSGPARPLLVLLHGVASNMTRWSELVATTTLRASWDLLRVDLRGHGLSVFRGRIGMPEWCADLAAILAAEGYARAVVAGHCLGANIAIEFAARYPAKAAGLVLIEPMFRAALTGHMRRIARLRPLFLPAAGLVRALNALGVHRRRLAPLDLEALDRETRGAIAARRAADAALARYASPVLDLRTTPTLTYLRALIAVTRELPELSTIAVPVLALLASGSRFTDPVRTEAALAALPHLDLERLPARHWIPTEEPEAMRRAIERWCSALPAGPP